MQFIVPAVLLAGAASAQGVTGCPGQPVLESCLVSTTALKNACKPADYNCLCNTSREVFRCFSSSGCNADARSAGAQSEMQAYCAYVTTSTAIATTGAGSSSSMGGAQSTTTAVVSNSNTGSATTSTGTSTKNGSATTSTTTSTSKAGAVAAIVVPTNAAAVAAVMGFVGAML